MRPKAIGLLKVLVDNGGRTVSAAELESILWPHRVAPHNGLSVLVAGLRKALCDSRLDPIIETFPGHGYRFVARIEPVQMAALPLQQPGRDQAQSFYEAARANWDRRSQESLTAALDGFEASVVIDPKFALAYVGISDTLSTRSFYGQITTPFDWDWSKHYAYHALSIDDRCGPAYASVGRAAYLLGQFGLARLAFDRWLAVQPEYATGHQWLSNLLMAEGKAEQSIFHARRAVGLRRAAAQVDNLGHMLFYAGRFEEAEKYLKEALELDPSFAAASCFLGLTHAVGREWDEAIRLCSSAVSLNSASLFFKAALAYATAKAGAVDHATRIEHEILACGNQHGGTLREALALVACGLGRFDDARSNLGFAIAARAPWTLFSQSAPMYRAMPR